jgi:hypothetical protein
VQKFTASGQFVLEIGREVNPKTKGNLCTHEEELKEAIKCGPAATRRLSEPYPGCASERGGFVFVSLAPGDLAVGPKARSMSARKAACRSSPKPARERGNRAADRQPIAGALASGRPHHG